MSIRKITALTSLLSFILTIITSVVLYITPQGRIANWADWRLWGLSKEQWGAIHTNLGILLILALFVHVYYNWKPITFYLKTKAKQLRIFTREFNIALVISLIFTAGTLMEIPPFSTIIEFSESIKDDAVEVYGEPPYGHAELSSLKTFSSKMGIDVDISLELLKKAGYKVEGPKDTLAEIAKNNDISPQKVYETIQPGAEKAAVFSGEKKEMPESPPTGTGAMTLADLSSSYNLNIKAIVRGLKDAGINAAAEQTLKTIAQNNNTSPSDVYEAVRKISLAAPKQEKSATGGQSSGQGYGKMTLAELCEKESIDLDKALEKIAQMGIKVEPSIKMRELAGKLKTTPFDLIDELK